MGLLDVLTLWRFVEYEHVCVALQRVLPKGDTVMREMCSVVREEPLSKLLR